MIQKISCVEQRTSGKTNTLQGTTVVETGKEAEGRSLAVINKFAIAQFGVSFGASSILVVLARVEESTSFPMRH